MAYRSLYRHNENDLPPNALLRTKQPKVQQLGTIRIQADTDRFLHLAGHVERAIETEVLCPNHNFICGICGYREMCEEW